MSDRFSFVVDGEALRTSLCGENGVEDDRFMVDLILRYKYSYCSWLAG